LGVDSNEIHKNSENLLASLAALDAKLDDPSSWTEDEIKAFSKVRGFFKINECITDIERKAAFNYQKAKEAFLSQERAKNTRFSYSKSMDLFEDWLQRANTHPFDVDHRLAGEFLSYLSNLTSKTDPSGSPLAPRTARLMFSAVRSFYSELIKNGDIQSNPFKDQRLPFMRRARNLLVPDEDEISALFSAIEERKNITDGKRPDLVRQGAEKLGLVLDLLLETGIRVGSLKTLSFKKTGSGEYAILYHSKGKDGKAVIPVELWNRAKSFDWKSVTESQVQRAVSRYCARAGIRILHPHSFRHYFAVTHYRKYKDIWALMTALNHSNTKTTDNYLRSLNALV
jgi:integrase